MANPFFFSQAVFFKREKANPINQEARILDFGARPVVAKKHMHTVHFCALIPFTIILYHVEFQNFCLYIYSPRISIDMNTE